MMTQLYDILAALCLPALLAVALLLRALGRGHRRAAEAEARLRQQVDRLRAARAALERTSCTDPLTGVWNYRFLQTALDREVARCARHPHRSGGGNGAGTGAGDCFALLLLEVDGFDTIRRQHGRRRGGAVLRDLAQRLALEFREADVFGRYGGEEFLVLLPDTDRDGAEHAAERLRWTVRRHPLPLPAVPVPTPLPEGEAAGNGLTAHIGIASLPQDGVHAALLLRAADRSLAEAKEQGTEGQATEGRGAEGRGTEKPCPDGSERAGGSAAYVDHSSLRSGHELPQKTRGTV